MQNSLTKKKNSYNLINIFQFQISHKVLVSRKKQINKFWLFLLWKSLESYWNYFYKWPISITWWFKKKKKKWPISTGFWNLYNTKFSQHNLLPYLVCFFGWKAHLNQISKPFKSAKCKQIVLWKIFKIYSASFIC